MAAKTFIAAVEEKYADCDIAVSDTMFVLKNMDVAGSDGKVHVPREMSLHRLGVTCAGDTTRIREICCQVTSLDVTNNLLTDWKEIFTILSCMPRVNFLNLSENILTEPLLDIGEQTFPNVTQLALNSTSIPLRTVESLLQIMPNVRELHLCMNGYTSLTHQHQHPSVTTLYLNGNKLSDFGEILKLSPVFPNLHQLLLLQNPFTMFSATEQIQPTFLNLECMNITETGINDWSELEKLRHFPALTDIRMKNLPLFKGMEEKLRRQFIVSYLPSLTKLNMSTVGEEERTTAERRFVQHFVDKDDKPARFTELEAKHGRLDSLAEVDFTPPTHCTVQVHIGDKKMAEKTFISAVEEKYADCGIAVSDNMFVLKNMDVAGSDGKVHVPREMSLHRLGVTCAGDTSRIREICCQVTRLDVTNNLLTDWKEIFTILSCMPKVNFFNLSENNLTEPLLDIGEQTFPNVTQLALNSTSIPLKTVELLLQIMPNVKELHLCMNGYTSLTHQHQHPSVTTLYLNGNKLSDFGEILNLSPVYPNLRQLLLLQNPFTTFPAAEQIQPTFLNLECMNITETGINDWSELEKLRHFPALTDIGMKKLPLFKGMEEKLRRQFIVSYLPALINLNMSKIGGEERTTAERWFVRHFVDKDNKPARFAELEAKHGRLDPLVDVDFSTPTHCTVEVHIGDNAGLDSADKVVMQSIKLDQKVGELKKTLAKELTGEPSKKFNFFHQKPLEPHEPFNLACRMTVMLHTLYVDEGDIFFLQRKLVPTSKFLSDS